MSNLGPMSLRAYARRRAELGLAGATVVAVSKAVKGGRLKASVVRDERGQPKIADPELADREWRYSRRSLPASAAPLVERLVEIAEALRQQLEAAAIDEAAGTNGGADGDA